MERAFNFLSLDVVESVFSVFDSYLHRFFLKNRRELFKGVEK